MILTDLGPMLLIGDVFESDLNVRNDEITLVDYRH